MMLLYSKRTAESFFSAIDGSSAGKAIKMGLKRTTVLCLGNSVLEYVSNKHEGLMSLIKDPSEVVKVQQKVQVTVLNVDRERRRIGLSMRPQPDEKNNVSGKTRYKPRTKKPTRQNAGNRKQPFHNPFAELLGK